MTKQKWSQADKDLLWSRRFEEPHELRKAFPGRSLEAVRQLITRLARERGEPSPYEVKQEVVKNPQEGITRKFDASGQEIQAILRQEIKTADDLFRVCEIDPLEWEIVTLTCGAWNSITKDGEGEAQIHQLFKVSAKLKPRTTGKEAREALVDLLSQVKPYKASAPTPRAQNGHTLEVSIADIHLGKLAHADETGHQNYDTKIAERLYMDAFEDLVSRAPKLSEIILVVGNDLLNSDNQLGTTTAGTRQDIDTRIHRTYRTAQRIIFANIERALELAAKVRVVVCPGNHDALLTWTLGEVLHARFDTCKRVEILNEPRVRQYVRVGQTLLMFTHGDGMKISELDRMMTREEKRLWSECDHHEIHVGHFHHEKVIDQKGVIVRVLPSLCPPDAWHSKMGYIGSKQAAQAFLWHKSKGLEAVYYHYPL